MLRHFHIRSTLDDIIRHRKGEVKLGERFQFLEGPSLDFVRKRNKKLRFALIGIPESIGIRANQGAGGSEHAWQEFLFQFANLQSNRFLEGSEILCLGQVETMDLQQRASELNSKDAQFYTKLRSLCLELDERVAPVIEQVVRAGLVPIVIGGGHNNAFPILKGVFNAMNLAQGMGCVNLDAHADFRPLEGRHSGNGFSYAYYQGYLQKYCVMGLAAQTNSEAMLKNMDLEPGVEYHFYRPGCDPDVQVLKSWTLPFGLEIDLDVMASFPSSGFSIAGYSLDQTTNFIKGINQQLKPAYLHLTKGQIENSTSDVSAVGNVLSVLVLEFIKTYTF